MISIEKEKTIEMWGSESASTWNIKWDWDSKRTENKKTGEEQKNNERKVEKRTETVLISGGITVHVVYNEFGWKILSPTIHYEFIFLLSEWLADFVVYMPIFMMMIN